MGLQSAPGYIGNGSYPTPVELDRNVQAALAGRRTGAFRYGDFALTPSGAAMQMTIARGDAVLMGGESSTTQGGYYAWSNASEVINWPASAGSPRIDTLLLRVIDLQYGTDASGNGALWQVHSGTPSGSPVALADSQFAVGGALHRVGAWWRVADVLVPAGATNLGGATVTPTRKYARIGRNTLCLSSDRPTDAMIGDTITIIDDNVAQLIYNQNSEWIAASGGAGWASLTPYMVAGEGANTFGYAPAVKFVGNTVKFRGNILKTSGGWATGATILNLPSWLRPPTLLCFSAATSAVANANTLTRLDFANTGVVSLTFTQGQSSSYSPLWVALDGIEYDIS